MLKQKLLHGIIQDLMKVPFDDEMHESEHGHEMPGDHKGVEVTVVKMGKPKDGMDPELGDDDELPMHDEEPMKKAAMNKAIHAKSKHHGY